MKKYLTILLTIFIASPFSSLLSNYFIYLKTPVTVREDYYEYWSFWGNVITVAIFQLPIYILVGIPVTLLIDWIIKDTKSNNNERTYLFQLFLYSLSALVLGFYIFTSSKNSTVGGAQIRYPPNKKTFKPSDKCRNQFWAKMVRRASDEKSFGGVAFFTIYPPGVQ